MESKGTMILVVEDDFALRYLAGRQLAKLGYKCILATNGKEALEIFKTEKIDLILMDVQMPVMDGLEASREIRAHEKAENLAMTPILAMTANPEKEQCLEAGMNDLVFKPILLDQLKLALSKWIGSARTA